MGNPMDSIYMSVNMLELMALRHARIRSKDTPFNTEWYIGVQVIGPASVIRGLDWDSGTIKILGQSVRPKK